MTGRWAGGEGLGLHVLSAWAFPDFPMTWWLVPKGEHPKRQESCLFLTSLDWKLDRITPTTGLTPVQGLRPISQWEACSRSLKLRCVCTWCSTLTLPSVVRSLIFLLGTSSPPPLIPWKAGGASTQFSVHWPQVRPKGILYACGQSDWLVLEWAYAPLGSSYSFTGTVTTEPKIEHFSPVLLMLLVATIVKAYGPDFPPCRVIRACLQWLGFHMPREYMGILSHSFLGVNFPPW